MEYLEKLKDTIKNLLSSKKFVTSMTGVIVVVLAEYDIVIPQESSEYVAGLVITFVGGQSLVDVAKEIKK